MILPILTRSAALAVTAILLVSCSSGSSSYSGPPRNQSDICAIFAERPDWRDAVEDSAAKWGAPVPVQMAIIWRESGFRSSVRPPKKYTLGFIPTGHISSAYGFAQAIDGTWDWYRRDTGNSGADRTDWEDATDFVGWYMHKSRSSNGIGMHDAYNQYLAYHEGHAGHRLGTYNKKAWLVDVAQKVAGRAAQYRGQLRRC
ncbi:MAG: transglycosylase SLT domain-containing protein [Pseudomonadota bacterium]